MEEQEREFITPEIDKRQHRRAKLVTQVKCENLGREDLLITRDISTGGVFVTTRNPYTAKTEVSISFRLSSSSPTLTCRGRVAYGVKNIGMGIEFFGLSEEVRQALQKFVDESS